MKAKFISVIFPIIKKKIVPIGPPLRQTLDYKSTFRKSHFIQQPKRIITK
jgi:hypothetical protein